MRMPLDIKLACRQLARNPGLLLTIVCSLAFGVGVNSALFSLIQAIWLRPLPVSAPDRAGVMHPVLNPDSKEPLLGDTVWTGAYRSVQGSGIGFAAVAAEAVFHPAALGPKVSLPDGRRLAACGVSSAFFCTHTRGGGRHSTGRCRCRGGRVQEGLSRIP
jgi:hypothetical protein